MTEPTDIRPQNRHAVLLLPGLCGTPKELGAIPKVLSDSGYEVTIAHIPGYADNKAAINWRKWIEETDRLFTEIREEADTVTIVGLSMGATLALKLAETRNDIDGIVLLSPVLRYDGWATPWYHFMIRVAYWAGFRNWSWQEKPPYGIANVELRRRVKKAVEQGASSEVGAAFISARHLYQAMGLMNDTLDSLHFVTVPTQVIHAVDDETAAPRNAEVILQKIKSEKRKAIWLGDSYHIITVDNEREVVVNETMRFVEECRISAQSQADFTKRKRRLKIKDRRG